MLIRCCGFIGIMFLGSCIKQIPVSAPSATNQSLVIEAELSPQGNRIRLSKISPLGVAHSALNKAGLEMRLSDETQKKTYTRFRLQRDGSYQIIDDNQVVVRGVIGHRYALNLNVEGKPYSAQAFINAPVRIKKITYFTSNNQVNLSGFTVFYDPPDFNKAHYIKVEIIQNKERDHHINIFSSEDKQAPFQFFLRHKHKDPEDIKMEIKSIEAAAFTFWRSVELNGNKLNAAPANPSSFFYDAIGYFQAYSSVITDLKETD